MEKMDKAETLYNSDDLFNEYFENMDLDSDMASLYELMGDQRLKDEYDKRSKLNKLRTENHKRYHNIKISKLQDITYDFDNIIRDTLTLYNVIDSKRLLVQTEEKAQNTKSILNKIYRNLNRLDKIVRSTLRELVSKNDERQAKFSLEYFNDFDLDENVRKNLISKYNKLLLLDPVVVGDAYSILETQIIRNKYINDILEILKVDDSGIYLLEKDDDLKEINEKINLQIGKFRSKINYLDDLIPTNSKYIENFNSFKGFFNKLIAYDDSNYNSAKDTYEILYDESKMDASIDKYEALFIEEIDKTRKEQKFVYEKFGIKNLRKSLDYISSNYMDILDKESKKVIEYIYSKLNSGKYDLKQVGQALSLIVKDIWKNTITNVYSYNPSDDYYFLCSNREFIDEKHQTILITKNEINKVDNYADYQIGFICSYNDNILYITENEDIMTVDYDDLSNLKTPVQIEQEFINFRICNRIALNGYQTKFEAVYFIDDGNAELYDNAIKLANTYNLPLIRIKKDKK